MSELFFEILCWFDRLMKAAGLQLRVPNTELRRIDLTCMAIQEDLHSNEGQTCGRIDRCVLYIQSSYVQSSKTCIFDLGFP